MGLVVNADARKLPYAEKYTPPQPRERERERERESDRHPIIIFARRAAINPTAIRHPEDR